MENTLLVALSRQIALRRELEIVANNMANVNTHGYRREEMQFAEYLMPVASADGFKIPDRKLSFVEDRASFHDFQNGSIQRTDNPLDVAIQGEAFFVVQTPQGERYTRDGGFQINPAGQLVTANGDPVAGENGPIAFDPDDTDIAIARDGTISTKEGIRGRLRLASFAQPLSLVKVGDNMFRTGEGQTAEVPAPGTVRLDQGSIESSNVKPVLEMSRLIEINRSYASISNLVQRGHELRKTAIERLAEMPS